METRQGLMNASQLHAYMSINDPKTKAMLSRSLGNTEVETAHDMRVSAAVSGAADTAERALPSDADLRSLPKMVSTG